ncbi:SPOSA6832_04996, partial [Sporobolomyces salmonicolor]
MAFGTDPATLKHEHVPFASAFDYAQLIMSRRFTNPIWPITERLNGTYSLMKKAAKTIDEYAFGLIDQREKELAAKASGSESGNGEENREDLLSLYMEIKDDSGKGLTRKALRRPRHIAVIVEEAERVTNVGRELDYDRLKDMHYTTAVFTEGLRLHPSVPANVWEAIEDNQVPNGPRIQKGDKVTWCDWAMARDPAVWGPDAGEFKPQRWLDSEGKFHKQSQTLATFEGVSVLARLFTSFDLSFASDYLATTPMVKTEWCGRETPLYANSLTLPMAQPLRVKASARKAEKN